MSKSQGNPMVARKVTRKTASRVVPLYYVARGDVAVEGDWAADWYFGLVVGCECRGVVSRRHFKLLFFHSPVDLGAMMGMSEGDNDDDDDDMHWSHRLFRSLVNQLDHLLLPLCHHFGPLSSRSSH